MKAAWQLYFSRPNKRIVFFASLSFLALTLTAFVYFLTFNESRPGYTLNDPVLNLFHPIAISEYIFFTTYFLGIYGLIIAFKQPAVFISLVQGYVIMTLLRMFCLYSVPLEPPVSIIPLKDSFLQSCFYSGRENLKDLFFSGHTATLFLFCFGFKKKELKWLFGIGGTLVAILILLQHVHYSIDVIAAPVFTYFAVWLQRKLNVQ